MAGLGQEVPGVVRAEKTAVAGLVQRHSGSQVSWPFVLLTGPTTHQLCGWREVAFSLSLRSLLGRIMALPHWAVVCRK